MVKALFLSPMVPSFDLAVTGRFFTDLLGFSLAFQSPTYAIYQKDHLTVHLLPAGENIGQMEFYLEVDDVDELWASMKDKVQRLKVREPFNQEYMMREVHIEVPATKTLLMVGQVIKG
ncbi:MAG: hypothetical protein IT270_01960 [Saprospiraceae bacterium]|mgnify:CR=1 FL=1|nr:hypothetical protein [Saprospiraceae bacterium]